MLPLATRGCGFIESDGAQAELGGALLDGVRVPASWVGFFSRDDSVTFAVQEGSDGRLEAYDIEALV